MALESLDERIEPALLPHPLNAVESPHVFADIETRKNKLEVRVRSNTSRQCCKQLVEQDQVSSLRSRFCTITEEILEVTQRG